MAKTLFLLSLCLFCSVNLFSQMGSSGSKSYLLVSQFNKDLTEHYVERFLLDKILEVSGEVHPYTFEAISTTSSGDITAVYYESEKTNQSGLILAFYGNYVNDNGISYTGYGFYHLDYNQAILVLDKLTSVLDTSDYYKDGDYFNYSFKSDELIFTTYKKETATGARVFWKDFDANWSSASINRTLKRLKKKVE